MAIAKKAALLTFFFLGLPLVYAQRPSGESTNAIAIRPFSYISSAVLDSQGNLFAFQPSALNSVFSTRLTVVTPGAKTVGPQEYPGSFVSIVAGQKAIYAVNTTWSRTGKPTTTSIDLVALRLDSGSLTMKSLALDGYVDIRVFPGQTADLLYLIQTGVGLVTPMATPVSQASVRLVQFDGAKFNTPVSVTLP